LKFKVKNLKITPAKEVGLLVFMENFKSFKSNEKYIKVSGRLVKEVLISFSSGGSGYLAAKAIIDHVFGSSGQITIKVFEQCLNAPDCVNNLPAYVALGVLGLTEVTRLYFRHKIRVKGEERWRGGFK
jgi:hypothetical protein